MKTLTWQKPGQQNVAQELIKIIINYVAELRFFKKDFQFITAFALSKIECNRSKRIPSIIQSECCQ
ncbi:hypothetical protein BACCOP_00539 [Phocaeicola coprocola DSM 17136]|uniref:Uncharacterized protein n=1 Tax=Phocaeicola coprocola DSM 17136 TaxID=470145 RepID=B3JF90_9BACT|nr:hypothetical protein BACCOP_00539 [Phocaeicola coprocola DSM 17136]